MSAQMVLMVQQKLRDPKTTNNSILNYVFSELAHLETHGILIDGELFDVMV